MRFAALACALACAFVLSARAQAYVDRVIEGGPQEEADVAEPRPYDPSGWPRYLRLETRLGTEPGTAGKKRTEAGVAVAGAIETPNHGAVSIDAAYSTKDDGSILTVRQRALPVGDGWFVNNDAGVFTALAPDVMRIPSRVFVPSAVIAGAATDWRGPGAVSVQASGGAFGRIQGFPMPGFKRLEGTMSMVGIQGRVDPEWTVGLRHAYGHAISEYDTPPPGPLTTADSTQLALRKEGPGGLFLANLVTTRSNQTPDSRYGAWMEGEWKDGPLTHGGGLYRLERNLSWAGQVMSNDIEGGFARTAFHSRPVSAEGSVDVFRTISANDDVGVLVTGSGQWRYSRQLNLGVGATLRDYQGRSGTGYLNSYWTHDWGRSGLRAELNRSGNDRSARLVYDHDWLSPLGLNLGARLSFGREEVSGERGRLYGVALSATGTLGYGATLTANLGSDWRSRGDRYDNVNASLSWPLRGGWSLEGNAFYSRGRVPVAAPLDPLAPPIDRLAQTDTTSYYLILRYEERAGSRTAPLGGAPGTGGGTIRGIVFLDGNRNGTREAGEPGAPNVTVYLDGRYATRTDSQGRFEFPMVAAGTRRVTVLNETLPLPWEFAGRGDVPVEVKIRETSELAIPVVRPD